ncbi:hypothetical protein PVAP13_2NG625400 [Panicum virgatum]|uniref:Uncharacterized protein n=1 Tax=Panicum virgatum TaxID=38727 RepID=A0A8T0W0K2_PANVG|nr:hypothetical protein PVAP13_2NG625400 [Panicum virgatum]
MFGSPRRGARVFPGETRPHLLGPGTVRSRATRGEARRALRRRAACSASLLVLPLHLLSKARLGAAAPPPSRRHPCSSPLVMLLRLRTPTASDLRRWHHLGRRRLQSHHGASTSSSYIHNLLIASIDIVSLDCGDLERPSKLVSWLSGS